MLRILTGLMLVLSGLVPWGAFPSPGSAETIRPTIRLELDIPPGEVAELRDIVERFARAEGFVVEDLVAQSNPPTKPNHVFLWLERGGRSMRVIVQNYLNTPRILILFYDIRSDPRFSETAAKLQVMIHERWPGQPTPMDDSDRVAFPPVPNMRLELRIIPEDADRLKELLQQFAQAEGFKILERRPLTSPWPGMRRPLSLKLTRGGTMGFMVEENIPAPGRFIISAYNIQSDPRFDETVEELQDLLRTAWPGRLLPYTG